MINKIIKVVKMVLSPRVKKGILVVLLGGAILGNIYASRHQIFKETEWIWRRPFASFEEKQRYRTSPEYYDFIKFAQQNLPEDVTVMIPPQAWPWPFSGHIEYNQYFLYPAKQVKDDRERILTDKSVKYIFLNWGEGFASMGDLRLLGYPKYYLPIKRIITMSGNKASYPAKSPYLEKFGLIEIERGTSEAESLAGLRKGTVEYHFHRAEFLRANGRYQEALGELQIAQKIAPGYAWIDYVMGDTWENLGRLDQAEFYYQRAIQKDSENGWFSYALGRLFEKLGREDEALMTYQKSLTVAPDNIWSSLALAQIFEKRGDLVNAIFFYKQTNFLGWGPNTLDSKKGAEVLKRLEGQYPDLVKKFKDQSSIAVKTISSFENEKEIPPSIQQVPGPQGKGVVLKSPKNNLTFPINLFSVVRGTIEFYWKPPEKIDQLPSEELVDLIHQLGSWDRQDGLVYVWAGRNYLGVGIFNIGQNKWYFLSSSKIKWQPEKWYLVSFSFGEKGMQLFLDNKLQAKNDYDGGIASLPLFLGGGRSVTFFDFPKPSSVGYGSFDELVFYQYQK